MSFFKEHISHTRFKWPASRISLYKLAKRLNGILTVLFVLRVGRQPAWAAAAKPECDRDRKLTRAFGRYSN